jgi:hypothetical protein
VAIERIAGDLIGIIIVKVRINSPRLCLIGTAVTCFMKVFVWGAEREFVFDGNVPDNL